LLLFSRRCARRIGLMSMEHSARIPNWGKPGVVRN
jgi:hypothetical protein